MLMKFRNIFCASALAATLALCVPHPVIAADAAVIRMARLRIKADQVEAFTAVVREEMAASLRLEPGVVAIYAVADKNDPTRLTFLRCTWMSGPMRLTAKRRIFGNTFTRPGI